MPDSIRHIETCTTLVLAESFRKNPETFRTTLEQAIAGGARTVVLRPNDSLTKNEINQLRGLLTDLCASAGNQIPTKQFLCMIEDDILLAKRLMAHGVLFTQEPKSCSFQRVREVLGSSQLIGLSIHSTNETPQTVDDEEIDFYYLRDSGELRMLSQRSVH